MKYQYITVPKKYVPYEAELFNPEGKTISITKVIQKVRNSTDMMIDEVGLSHRLTTRIPQLLIAETHQTFCMPDYTFSMCMN